jgi:general secretion pathway protein G
MNKSAFTMIELIFVIVILGILASVALPRLGATRTDAKISSLAQSIQSGVEEATSYATAQSTAVDSTPLTQMSRVFDQLVHQNQATQSSDGKKLTIYTDGDVNTGSACVNIEVNSTALLLSTESSNSAPVCAGLREIIKDANYTIKGRKVSF